MSESFSGRDIEALDDLLFDSRLENECLRDENRLLRDLLLECKPFLEDWVHAGEIWDKIKKELSDE